MLSESNKSAFGCCGTEAVQRDRERQQKAPNEFISLFYTQSRNTKLMISVMSQNLHERSLRRSEIPKALSVKSFLKPWCIRLRAGRRWGWEHWNLAMTLMATGRHVEKCMATWTHVLGSAGTKRPVMYEHFASKVVSWLRLPRSSQQRFHI